MTGKVRLINTNYHEHATDMWPGGQMLVREDKNIEQKPFEGGQILDLIPITWLYLCSSQSLGARR